MPNSKKNKISDREVVLNYIGENQKKEKKPVNQKSNQKQLVSLPAAKTSKTAGADVNQVKINQPALAPLKKTVLKNDFLPAKKASQPQKTGKKAKEKFNKNLLKRLDVWRRQKKIKSQPAKNDILPAKQARVLNLKKIRSHIKVKLKKNYSQRRQGVSKNKAILSRQLKINFDFWNQAICLSLKIFFLALIIFLTIYLFFNFLILGFSLDNKVSRYLANFLPVPGLITPVGIVEYYPYKDFSRQGQANELVRAMIVRKTLAKYGLAKLPAKQSILDQLILRDSKINKQPWARINKIRQLVQSHSGSNLNLKTVAQRNGVEYGIITISRAEAVKRFGSLVLSLPSGQISPIIIGPKGYYLVEVNNRTNSLYTLSYAFILGINWQDYINKQLADLWVWSAD